MSNNGWVWLLLYLIFLPFQPLLEGPSGFVCWARGFMELGTVTGSRPELARTLREYCSVPEALPLLLFPEEDTTNGRAGLLKFRWAHHAYIMQVVNSISAVFYFMLIQYHESSGPVVACIRLFVISGGASENPVWIMWEGFLCLSKVLGVSILVIRSRAVLGQSPGSE